MSKKDQDLRPEKKSFDVVEDVEVKINWDLDASKGKSGETNAI